MKLKINIEVNKFKEILLEDQKKQDEEKCALFFGKKANNKQLYIAYAIELVENIEHTRKSFLMDPERVYSLISGYEEEKGWELVAIFHTHPSMSTIYPSSKDIKFMNYWKNIIWLISNFSKNEHKFSMKGYYIINDEIKQVKIEFINQINEITDEFP